jgi:hypothetical protein
VFYTGFSGAISGWQGFVAAAQVLGAGGDVSGLQETFIMDLVDQCYRCGLMLNCDGWFAEAVVSIGMCSLVNRFLRCVHLWLAALSFFACCRQIFCAE